MPLDVHGIKGCPVWLKGGSKGTYTLNACFGFRVCGSWGDLGTVGAVFGGCRGYAG